ncbi:MAG TPA: cupin domain-containing protein [Candidatus Sulfotelmatobacter sp.]|nr:cupin domain-containing protein [Candidatus Sulfotelmatobacter sp.]
MTALTPRATAHDGLGPYDSRTVRADDLPWEPTRFPGVNGKTLLFDPTTGMATVLIKMDPGAVLPDHEHVMIEQTYVLEGSLVDKDGPEAGLAVGPGEFVWRPPGSRHAAWTPRGATFIAIFQIPNRFFDVDGVTHDMQGNEWEPRWGEALRKA